MASKCPYCAEPIKAGVDVCPACNEPLDRAKGGGGAPPPSGSKLPLILGIVAALLLGTVCLVGILATLLMPALMKAKEKANRTKCSNNLRQLGLAGIQYADDKRFYPHVRAIAQLDGDVLTGDTPKVVRTLVYYNYHDNPEGFVCPSSVDMFVPMSPGARSNTRTWFWDGKVVPEAPVSPLADGQVDPSLDQTYELSYGWSRRGMNANTPSSSKLAADRAMRDPQVTQTTDALGGNHTEGLNVLLADGTVNWAGAAFDDLSALAATNDRTTDGFLSIKPPQ
jgi:type II secretory pathway pseudopilin PulG